MNESALSDFVPLSGRITGCRIVVHGKKKIQKQKGAIVDKALASLSKIWLFHII